MAAPRRNLGEDELEEYLGNEGSELESESESGMSTLMIVVFLDDKCI